MSADNTPPEPPPPVVTEPDEPDELAALEAAFLAEPEAKGFATAESMRRYHHEAKIFRGTMARELRLNDRRHAQHENTLIQHDGRLKLHDERLNAGGKRFTELGKATAVLRPTLTQIAVVIGFVIGAVWGASRYLAAEFERERARTNAVDAVHEARLNAQAIDAAQQRALLERLLLQVDGIDAKIDRLR